LLVLGSLSTGRKEHSINESAVLWYVLAAFKICACKSA
jgi:hypothetical protein